MHKLAYVFSLHSSLIFMPFCIQKRRKFYATVKVPPVLARLLPEYANAQRQSATERKQRVKLGTIEV